MKSKKIISGAEGLVLRTRESVSSNQKDSWSKRLNSAWSLPETERLSAVSALLNEQVSYFFGLEETLIVAGIPENLVVDRVLGKGSFGAVFLADLGDKPVAMKSILLLRKVDSFIQAAREVGVMKAKTLEGGKALPLFYSAHVALVGGKLALCILMEPLNGSLFVALGQFGRLLERHVLLPDEVGLLRRHLAAQACLAFGRMNSGGIFHRDIKLENLGLEDDLSVKLLDVGLSQTQGSRLRIAGTPDYFPPEMVVAHQSKVRLPEAVSRQAALRAADLWALGVVVWELLGLPVEGGYPYANQRDSAPVGGCPFPGAVAEGSLESFLNGLLAEDSSERVLRDASAVFSEGLSFVAGLPASKVREISVILSGAKLPAMPRG